MAKNTTGGDSVHQMNRKKQDQDIRDCLDRIHHKILVMSGKGGVGKSTVAAYLAVALAKRHYRVGLMDIDLHGPSIPHILGLTEQIVADAETRKTVPIRYLPNLEVISIEMLLKQKDSAVVWRGPLKGGVIRQFISDVRWAELDYLIIDSPPGTGDEPLTIAQTVNDAEALIVTTPQEIALADVRKSIHFCRRVNMKILGLVENMSGLKCPFCGNIIDVFNRGGGIVTAEAENLTLLASLPLDPAIVTKGDMGDMGLLDDAHLPITQEYRTLVERVLNLHQKTASKVPGEMISQTGG